MRNLSGLELGAWYAGILLCLALLVRVYFLLGIAGRYRALTTFLLVSALRSVLLASVPFHRDVYAYTYLATAPLLYICHAWVVFELYAHVFEAYRGIAALSRWAIGAALLMGILVAVGTTLLDHDAAREPFPLLGLAMKLEAIVLKTLLAFLLLISAVLLWFPIPQRWNVVIVGLGVSAITLSYTAALVVRGLNPTAWTRVASTSTLYVFAGCMALWLFGLKPLRADITRMEAIPANEGLEAQLLMRLTSMNRTLESIRKTS